jgi:hypothetical protein
MFPERKKTEKMKRNNFILPVIDPCVFMIEKFNCYGTKLRKQKGLIAPDYKMGPIVNI